MADKKRVLILCTGNSAPPYFMEFAMLLAEHPLTADGH